VAEPRPADGEGRGERDLLVVLASEGCQAQRDVHVGRGEHAGLVEVAQQAGGAGRAADVERIDLDRAHGAPRSSTSLSSVTRAVGGRQAKTPHGVPSTAGVCAPTIPRRNR